MQSIIPMLWFNGDAEAAADFYASIFKESSKGHISRYGKGMPMPEGTALVVPLTLNGQTITLLNGGPQFKFTEAVSFVIDCKDQAEVDYYWEKLSADGGQESQCGWLKDKFGLSWQVVPNTVMSRVMGGADAAKSAKAMQAMMGMKKLDIAALEKAYAEG